VHVGGGNDFEEPEESNHEMIVLAKNTIMSLFDDMEAEARYLDSLLHTSTYTISVFLHAFQNTFTGGRADRLFEMNLSPQCVRVTPTFARREEDNHNEEVTRALQAQLESEVARQQSLAILKQQKFLALQSLLQSWSESVAASAGDE
jgi:hypothetical protein